jgi:hypothetical protein
MVQIENEVVQEAYPCITSFRFRSIAAFLSKLCSSKTSGCNALILSFPFEPIVIAS